MKRVKIEDISKPSKKLSELHQEDFKPFPVHDEGKGFPFFDRQSLRSFRGDAGRHHRPVTFPSRRPRRKKTNWWPSSSRDWRNSSPRRTTGRFSSL